MGVFDKLEADRFQPFVKEAIYETERLRMGESRKRYIQTQNEINKKKENDIWIDGI